MNRRSFLECLGVFSIGAVVGSDVPGKLIKRVSEKINKSDYSRYIHNSVKEKFPSKVIKIAFIGVGNRGMELLKICSSLFDEHVKIVGVCDIESWKMERALKVIHRSVFMTENYKDIYQLDGLDAVIIATPNYLHHEMTINGLNSQINIYLEKPIAVSKSECLDIVKATNMSNAMCHVGFEFRYHPLYLKVKELVDSGAVGTVRNVYLQEMRSDWARFYPHDLALEKKTNWRYFKSLSGGSILEKLCHDFDIYNYILGETPYAVLATGGRAIYTDRETIDHANITLQYKKTMLNLQFSLFSSPQKRSFIFGSEKTLEFDRGGDVISVLKGEGRSRTLIDEIVVDKYTAFDDHGGTVECLMDFFDSFTDGHDSLSKPESALSSTIIALAVQRSIENLGVRVQVEV